MERGLDNTQITEISKKLEDQQEILQRYEGYPCLCGMAEQLVMDKGDKICFGIILVTAYQQLCISKRNFNFEIDERIPNETNLRPIDKI